MEFIWIKLYNEIGFFNVLNSNIPQIDYQYKNGLYYIKKNQIVEKSLSKKILKYTLYSKLVNKTIKL